MPKKIFMDCSINQTRIVYTKDGEALEVFIEDARHESLVGNIYAGLVKTIVPGGKAAFVDIGASKNAYLELKPTDKRLKHGDSVTVQVLKDSYMKKGAVVTSDLSFPGSFLVLVNEDLVSISKKITGQAGRDKLFKLAKEVKPKGCGLIVRTNAISATAEDFAREVAALKAARDKLTQTAEFIKPPGVLKQEPLYMKILRDVFTEDTDEFVVNSRDAYENIQSLVSDALKPKLKLYENDVPMLDYYFLESQIERALERKVWLKNGGFIVFDRTEACTVIDVNTGKSTAVKGAQNAALKTNLEAASEIAKQLRLRNLSGIIIIDFISMKNSKDSALVQKTVESETAKDRIKTTVVGFTQLGLMQLTRRKTSPPIAELLSKKCRNCDGEGHILSAKYLSDRIKLQVESLLVQTIFNSINITVHSVIANELKESQSYFNALEERHDAKITIVQKSGVNENYFKIEKEKV